MIDHNDPIVRRLVYKTAFMQHRIEMYADWDGIGQDLVNDTSLLEDADDCKELLKEVSAVSPEHAAMVKEESAKAKKEATYADEDDEDEDDEE